VLWAQPAAAQAPGDSTPAPPTGTSPAFVIQSDNGDNRLQFGVVVQSDGRFAIDDPQDQVLDTFTLRRFRGIAQGRVARYFDFYVNVDFAGGIVNVRDAYFDTIFSPAFHLRVGKTKAPFSYDRNILVVNTLLGERGLTTTVAPDRDIGVQLMGDLAGARLSYAVALTNGVVDGGSSDGDTNEPKDVTARIIARPWTRSPDHFLSGLGLSVAANAGTHGPALPSFVSVGRQIFFSYAGAADSGRRSRWSPQAFYYRGPFGTYTEYVRSSGAIVKDVARRFGIYESLLYRWRRLMRTAAPTGGLPSFVPVTITPEPDRAEPPSLPSAPSPSPTPAAVAGAVLEVMLPDGARVRLEGAVDPTLAAAVLRVLATSGRAP